MEQSKPEGEMSIIGHMNTESGIAEVELSIFFHKKLR